MTKGSPKPFEGVLHEIDLSPNLEEQIHLIGAATIIVMVNPLEVAEKPEIFRVLNRLT